MRQHLPVGLWQTLFKEIEANNLHPEVVRRALDLNNATFYRKRRQYLSGGVLPRKPGSGRKRTYHARDYEQRIRETLREMPYVSGHRRIFMTMKKRGAVPYSMNTSYRIVKELGLLVPKAPGRCRKHYEPLNADAPGQLWVADTTTVWIGNQRMEIYLALDACSRWVPCVMVSPDRMGTSTLRYYEKALESGTPVAIHTDNGTEFANRNAIAYLKERNVMWRHGPSHTPEAQGLVERLVKTFKEEWLDWKSPTTITELEESVKGFVNWYNSERIHSSIGWEVPEAVHHAEA